MKYTLNDFREKINKLPIKESYSKDELLTREFLIDKDNKVEIYYSPHNEYINKHAKIFIIGITPGFQQMNNAIVTARKALNINKPIKEIQYECKVVARFSGSLRKNMIIMLDEINLNKFLDLTSCGELFDANNKLLHTVSLIPYPVFINEKNYSGHSPKLINSNFLMKYVYGNFVEELKNIENYKEIILIPLGKAVESVLLKLENDGIIYSDQILRGFPHPSGANGNRLKELKKNKDEMILFLIKKLL